MNQTVTSLYLSPWSLRDPLCQSQSLSYLKILANHGYQFALITFETSKFALSGEELQKTKQDLAEKGIYWYPVNWHLGLALPQKTFGGLKVLQTVIKAARKHKPKIVHSRSSTPAFFAMIIAKMFGIKFLYDADSVLSQEYVDVGHWSPNSLNFKILEAAESAARLRADEIIVLTETLKRDFIKKFEVKKNINVIPCCVDVENFSPLREKREIRRRQLGLNDEKLLIYVGKIGVRYQVEKIFEFYKSVGSVIKAKLLIVSLDPPEEFHEIARKNNVDRQIYFIVSANKGEVKEWLSAADAGIAFIKESESERGSSPIKISEYLASGLPALISDNIGDISSLVELENIGLIIKNHTQEDYRRAAFRFENLWKDDSLTQKCRQIAHRTFDLKTVGGRKYLSIYKRLLEEK